MRQTRGVEEGGSVTHKKSREGVKAWVFGLGVELRASFRVTLLLCVLGSQGQMQVTPVDQRGYYVKVYSKGCMTRDGNEWLLGTSI